MAKAPVNEYYHNRTPINVEHQVIIRSNVDLIYSYAVVDVTEEATFTVADFSKAFGTPDSTDPEQHTLGAALGWGGLPPQHAQYFQALATCSGCDVWTFAVPPLDFEHNGYFSVVKYTDTGWLDVLRPGLSDSDLVRNADGTITVYFGDETREYIESLRAAPIQPVDG